MWCGGRALSETATARTGIPLLSAECALRSPCKDGLAATRLKLVYLRPRIASVRCMLAPNGRYCVHEILMSKCLDTLTPFHQSLPVFS